MQPLQKKNTEKVTQNRLEKNKSTNSLSKKEKEKVTSTNKSQKNLNKLTRGQRSSTTQLNQYTKLYLLQKNEHSKPLGLVKKYGSNIKSLLVAKGVGKKSSQDQLPKLDKVNQFLQNLKKKKLTSNQVVGKNSGINIGQKQVTAVERIIKTQQKGSRKSLHIRAGSIGKLCLGKNILPQRILTKEQRWNPFYEQTRVISQNMINNKGVYNLVNTGLIPLEYDFLDILNNKYEMIPQIPSFREQTKPIVIIKNQEDNAIFMTNPVIVNNFQEQKKMLQAQINESGKIKNPTEETQKRRSGKIRKSKAKKVKKVKNDPFQQLREILAAEVPFLPMINGKVQKNQQYRQFLKRCLSKGTQQDFFQLVNKMEIFTTKYKMKKIKFQPNLVFAENLNENRLILMIENHKVLGYDKAVNKKSDALGSVVLRAIEMHRMKKMKFYLKKIENLKKYFRMKKLYHQCVGQRYGFYKYRLGSFSQEQRKFIQSFVESQTFIADYSPKVEIHILTKQITFEQESSYYKLRERLRAHLMRLFNSKPADIIILVDSVTVGDVKEQMEIMIKMAMKFGEKTSKFTNNLPNIHILQTSMNQQNISYTGRTYFGISSQIIRFVRDICKGQKPVVIPYESSRYLPFLCEVLNANLFGGTYTKESFLIVFEEDNNTEEVNQINQNGKASSQIMYKKLWSRQTFQNKIAKIKTFKLANSVYENKSKIYELFSTKHKKLMPYRIQTKSKTQIQFYEELARKIVTHKESTKWVFKLSQQKFSRGLAILETNDLKIFQQSRKKLELTTQDVTKISKLMNIILRDKLIMSHPNLMERRMILDEFFSQQNSYIEEYIENAQKICIFGKILPNGTFVFLGSYKKLYTNGVGFGASYPAEQVNEDIIEELNELSMGLFEQNVFGYATFEFLYQQKSKRFFYLDFTPNLQEYSSLYFLYDSLFTAERMYPQDRKFNKLPRSIFYCPFLDNNGNKYENVDEFIDECRANKVFFNSEDVQGQMFIYLKNDPSILGLITLSNSEYQSIKLCVEAISLLVQLGGKFSQFDKKSMGMKNVRTDGLYIMDILWKLRQVRKKMESQYSD